MLQAFKLTPIESILLLTAVAAGAVAMGIQAVIGQTISITTIVFTTTLTKLVVTIADSIANGDTLGLEDIKMQSAVVVTYLFGALLAGALIIRGEDIVVPTVLEIRRPNPKATSGGARL